MEASDFPVRCTELLRFDQWARGLIPPQLDKLGFDTELPPASALQEVQDLWETPRHTTGEDASMSVFGLLDLEQASVLLRFCHPSNSVCLYAGLSHFPFWSRTN